MSLFAHLRATHPVKLGTIVRGQRVVETFYRSEPDDVIGRAWIRLEDGTELRADEIEAGVHVPSTGRPGSDGGTVSFDQVMQALCRLVLMGTACRAAAEMLKSDDGDEWIAKEARLRELLKELGFLD